MSFVCFLLISSCNKHIEIDNSTSKIFQFTEIGRKEISEVKFPEYWNTQAHSDSEALPMTKEALYFEKKLNDLDYFDSVKGRLIKTKIYNNLLTKKNQKIDSLFILDSISHKDITFVYIKSYKSENGNYEFPPTFQEIALLIFSKCKFKEKLNTLKTETVLNYDHEMGFAVSYPPAGTGITDTQYQPMDNKINTGKVTLPEGDRFFGYMHTHNNEDGVIKIFSNADISTFLTQCVRNAGNYGSMSDAYCMVITSNGSYMLRYTGDGSYNIGPNQLAKWEKYYKIYFEELTIEDMSDQSNIEKMFTKFLKDVVKINGLELYRVTDTTSEKLEYDGPDKPVKSTRCS